ncbi:thiol peroxidase (atypical 2-Cys peroxiredoxin) [Shewanella psychrophila]|uniref:Thiol peroxidase (Atypical 2-Cys peroxiredoxin) n=1 Tax=Shewanella psychrophila TaxID=225848 RepID=A0A1S6HSZ5_9GAMM|nr:thiol peroxidase [Shewanella psychrophila]AQS38631.1 thiol peroxidase (atypical 2-Cys peroxiredoxin) [Shewanella psychrophila]
MQQTKLYGDKISVSGTFPKAGTQAPEFSLCTIDLEEINLSSFAGKKLLLNIFLSVDTPVCATSVQKFNEQVNDDTVVLCISADLPFSASRFCISQGFENITMASFFRSPEFTEDYGVNLNQGRFKGLASRAVIVINEEGLVCYSELVKDISREPNYTGALSALANINFY